MSKSIKKKVVKHTAKNTEKMRVRKPRTEAQKARRRELDAIRHAEAKKHAVAAKPAKNDYAPAADASVAKAISAFGLAISTAWNKLIKALE